MHVALEENGAFSHFLMSNYWTAERKGGEFLDAASYCWIKMGDEGCILPLST